MSIINSDIIYKTAKLAQLAVDDQEVKNLQNDLTQIFKLFETLDQTEISNLTPLGHPLQEQQRLRADIAQTKDLTESIEQNAPVAEDGFITVPKVIE